MEVHKQYNLRNKKVATNPPKNIQIDTPSTSQRKIDPPKEATQKQDANVKEVERPQPSSNIEYKLSKVKIYVPLTELMKRDVYRSQVIKELKI